MGGDARPTVEVWELQRRATLFHSEWRAPFLPHDRQKRWRWVGSGYRRHPLAVSSLEASALADSPILQLPPEWPQDKNSPEAWAVVKDGSRGPCCEQGWQYAADFYESDRWWQQDPMLCHCRRRLWRCSLDGEPFDAEPLGKAAPARRFSAPAVATAPRHSVVPTSSPAATTMTKALDEELVPAASSHASLSSELEGLLAPEWGPGSLVVEFLKAQGATDIRVGPWLQGPDQGDLRAGVREVEMLLPVPPAPMTPRTTRATVRYHVSAEGRGLGARLCFDAVIATLDTPFCDCYTILDRVALSPAVGGITVQKEFCVQFLKGTLARSMIESSTKAAQKQVAQVFLEVLRRRAGGVDAADQGGLRPVPRPRAYSEEEEDTSVTEVWELQRRATLFHDTWRAPFLPHDGHKRWRWVDRRYRKHPWAEGGSRQASASSSEPPLGPPDGDGHQAAQWARAETPGPSDGEGWQYAVDFCSSDAMWGNSPAMHHCRRRLWRLEKRTASSEPTAPWGASGDEWAVGVSRAAVLPLVVFACTAIVVAALIQSYEPTAAVLGVGRTASVACALAVVWDKRASSKVAAAAAATGARGRRSSRKLLDSAARWLARAQARRYTLRMTEDDIENRWCFVTGV